MSNNTGDIWAGLIVAYGIAQAALVILRITGTIRWHWAAVLFPTLLVGGLIAAILIAGIIVGIIRTVRQDHKEEDNE